MKSLMWIAVIFIFGSSIKAAKQEWKKMSASDQVEVVVSELERCPAWVACPPEAQNIRSSIVRILETLNVFDTDVLRQGITRYWERHCDIRSPNVDFPNLLADQSKVFLAIRVFFKAPVQADFDDAMSLGPFVAPSDKGVNLLWPLEESPDGKLILSGRTITAVSSPGYDGPKDFHFMETHYPRRCSWPK